MSRYSRQLEESSFRGQTAEFAWLTLFSATSLLLLSIITEIAFLGPALSSSFIYIWARRNPGVRLSVLGLFVFPAPYMPWFLIGLGALLNRHVPKEDLCGLAVGHGE